MPRLRRHVCPRHALGPGVLFPRRIGHMHGRERRSLDISAIARLGAQVAVEHRHTATAWPLQASRNSIAFLHRQYGYLQGQQFSRHNIPNDAAINRMIGMTDAITNIGDL